MALRAIELEIFNKILAGIAEEMGIVLRRSAFSPNIRERRDFSCAIFDKKGELIAQASHIPVHLGAMPLTMKYVLPQFDWHKGDIIITNDPFQGGTHLPDITLIKPIFVDQTLYFFLITRAHHADVGGQYPGSMAVTDHIEKEGVLIKPTKIIKQGNLDKKLFQELLGKFRNPFERQGDLKAQLSSLERGEKRLLDIIHRYGLKKILEISQALKEYTKKAMYSLIKNLPRGEYSFTDYLDDDGFKTKNIAISVEVEIKEKAVIVDFSKTDPQVKGSVNAPRAVTEAAVYYVFLSLLNTIGDYPINQGCFSLLNILTKPGTVVDAQYPAAVAAGNVETSQRIVDVLLGALAKAMPWLIPAASCGTMNNVAIGGFHPKSKEEFTYYETIGGGMGARPKKDGLSGVHTHMTNTLNTPIEAIEHEYPFLIEAYYLRKNSGGKGRFNGGDGLVRIYQFLSPCNVTILSERRTYTPYGLNGGAPGKQGENFLIDKEKKIKLPSKVNLKVKAGNKLIIKTPGGGGWGKYRRRKMERTLVLIKPDGVNRNLIGEVIKRFETAGFKVVGLKMLHLNKKQAEAFYAVHKGKAFFEELTQYMSSGPIVAMVLEGENAILKVREIMGATDPKEAKPGTIRADLALSKGENTVHGADSPENAAIEIAFFFGQYELM